MTEQNKILLREAVHLLKKETEKALQKKDEESYRETFAAAKMGLELEAHQLREKLEQLNSIIASPLLW